MSDQPASLFAPPQAQEPPTPPAPSLMDQIVGVFTEPKALFTSLRARPTWLPALLAAVIIALIAGLIWASKVDMAEATRHQMERMQEVFHINMPDQAVDEAISRAEGKQPWISSISSALLAVPGIYLVVALIVWAFAAMGRQEGEEPPTFGQAFSVTSVHYLATLPSVLLAAFIALLRPVGGANLQQLMPTSLSFFLLPESAPARGLIAWVDPLWIFSFVVLAIGMKHTLRTKPWAIGLCLAVFGLFGGGFKFLGGMLQ